MKPASLVQVLESLMPIANNEAQRRKKITVSFLDIFSVFSSTKHICVFVLFCFVFASVFNLHYKKKYRIFCFLKTRIWGKNVFA